MTLTAHQITFLNTVPTRVLGQLIADYASDSIGVAGSTFFLAMAEPMRDVQPLDVLDYAFARIREKVANRDAAQ